MALNSRDSNFPSTSIGRTQGRQIAPPQDPLGAHPLASSLPSDAPNPSQTVPAPPPYVPYTPRQRPATTTASATLNASVSISSSSPSHGEATSRLQLQGLKATVQTVGIDNNSIGWAILEKLVAGEVEGPEWDEIWNVIASGSVTLILPREQVSNGTIMTPEFVRDHVAFCVVPFKESSPLVTLGGLRGFVDGQKISIRTALPTHHKRFLAVKKPSMRAHALLSLPPLYNGFNPEGPFPTFSVSAYLSSLALPSRPTPVALPSVPTRQNPPVTSRLANPFSTLFGSRSSAVPPASVPPRPSSPYPPSIKSEGSLDHPSPYSAEGHIVSAFVVDRKIIRKDVVRASSKALKSTIKMELDGLPMWLPDRILRCRPILVSAGNRVLLLFSFTAPLQPFHKSYSLLQKLNDSSSPISTTSNAPPTIVDTESVDAMANSFQDFYDAITHDLERSGSLMEAGLKNRLSSNQDNISAIHSQAGVQDTNIVGSYPEDEAKEIAVKDALERIEECMSKMFYDQMFSPLECDDTSHDEALSSRIAALGILDLGWQHLGVEMDDGETNSESINELVAKCGKILEKLHDRDHHSPRAKAEVLLAVHKEIVEALSSLPPLRLKPENEKMQPEPADFTASHSTRDPSILSTKFREGSEMHQGLIKEAELKQLSPLASPRAVLDKSPLRDDSASIPSQVGINITSESPERAPTKTLSPTKKTPVNTDVILPIIIYSIVKANPIQLVSHLLFIERYRSRKVGGEESYCLVNFLAAVEFLEHVDMQALGLGEADRVMRSAFDLFER
ncbi:uncharacterized protein EI90DRAFT_3157462 [Cantharellus anzutake]|uniref:uncharacterized protein n=1 Tax=Cantharellus anzutake TaxID=1750568 RepID=UPI001907C247|nr:uncharacterized protein EI90DRAFT_3157462 [Cantharellus anzutake]KAF8324324.1 hypothetical protein EI90DRAFT_3157462 [Cantharellus anzutake]